MCNKKIVLLSVFLIFNCIINFINANENNIINEKPLKVYLIPHSHCDGGWLYSYDEYFKYSVNSIITGVIHELNNDIEKKFNWVEIGFFSEWYNKQNEEIRNVVKKLINNKQLSFITGGLIQNDEATSNIDDIIEQMTQGHQWLKNNLNYSVEYAWQIDPFGYSSITPTLFSQMGIKGLIINRVSNDVKKYMKDHKSMEFIWRGSDTLSGSSELLVSTLDDHYSYPSMIDPYKSSTNSINKKVEKFINYLHRLSNTRNTNILMVPLGDDFRYSNASDEFKRSKEWLSVIVSNKSKYNIELIKYATLSEYFEELNNQLLKEKKQLLLYDKDFFPYSTGKNDIWSGYYSTRPVLKKQIRDSSNLLRHSEIIYTFAKALELNSSSNQLLDFQSHLNENRNLISISQHHDIVTGTSRSYVLNDSFKKLQESSLKSYNIISNSIESLLNNNTSSDGGNNNNNNKLFGIETCLNLSELDQDFYSIVFQNSLGWSTKQHVSIRIKISKKLIKNLELIQLSTKSKSTIQVLPIRPYLNNNNEDIEQEYNLITVISVDALGLNTYMLRINKESNDDTILSKITKIENPQLIQFENRKYRVQFNMNGYINSIQNLQYGSLKSMDQSFNQYKSKKGGAYIMNPGKREKVLNRADQYYVYDGPLVSQLNLFYGIDKKSLNVSSIVIHRLYKYSNTNESKSSPLLSTENYIETGYSIKGELNREKTFNYKLESFDSESGGLFYTDNGLENRERYYDKDLKKPNNYYPTLHYLKLKNSIRNEQATVYIDRSFGVTSPSNGEIEIMLHRSMSKDDSKGLSWPNKDTSRSDGKLYFSLDSIDYGQSNEKKLSYQIDHPPIFMVKKYSNITSYLENYKINFSPLKKDLPSDVHLMTLKTYDNDKIGLRLFNFYKNTQNLNLNNLFIDSITINNLNKTSLSFLNNNNGNNSYRESFLQNSINGQSSLRRDDKFPIKSGRSEYKFHNNQNNNLHNSHNNQLLDKNNNNNYNINPLEIKSFILNFANNNINSETIIKNNNNNNSKSKVQKIANYLVIDKKIEENRYTYDFSVYPIQFSYYNDRGRYYDNTLRNILILSICIPVVFIAIVILVVIIYRRRKLKQKQNHNHQQQQNNNNDNESKIEDRKE